MLLALHGTVPSTWSKGQMPRTSSFEEVVQQQDMWNFWNKGFSTADFCRCLCHFWQTKARHHRLTLRTMEGRQIGWDPKVGRLAGQTKLPKREIGKRENENPKTIVPTCGFCFWTLPLQLSVSLTLWVYKGCNGGPPKKINDAVKLIPEGLDLSGCHSSKVFR